jgi:predicted polyphosphate/ATP-dependent NAD kinase
MNPIPESTSVGIIANPYSSRDIRRLVSSASSIQTVERANIVERILVTLATFGIDKAIMMPDKSGLAAQLIRNLESRSHLNRAASVDLEFLDIPITSTVTDTLIAGRIFRERNVGAVIVLGGDGTHRAVARYIGDIPMVSISTGTNNAFPRFHEATLAGLALGIYLKGLVNTESMVRRNKVIRVTVNNNIEDLALVDLAITSDRWVGARAVWKMENLKELYLAFCEPAAIGMSSIGGLLDPVSRKEMSGLKVLMADPVECPMTLNAPVAPGLFHEIGILDSSRIEIGVDYEIESAHGVLALDGEREIEFSAKDEVIVRLEDDGPVTLDVEATIESAARSGVFVNHRTAGRSGEHKFRMPESLCFG